MKIKCCQTDYRQLDYGDDEDDVGYEIDLCPMGIWQCILIIPYCIAFELWYIITQT